MTRIYANLQAADTTLWPGFWAPPASPSAWSTFGLEQVDLERAMLPSLAGVKVDKVVIERDGRYLFDGRRVRRSLLSYRIADVPREVLAGRS